MVTDRARVLLIEDNPADARLVREELTASDDSAFSLECADRLSTGLGRLAEGNIDVVLLDLFLPDSAGAETFAQACQQAPDLPIVVLSSLNDEGVAHDAVKQGAQDYLVKGQISSRGLRQSLSRAIVRKTADQVHSRQALVLALNRLIACRDHETAAHLLRVRHYCSRLAREAVATYPLSCDIDERFLEMLECCAPLHDIGKLAIPDGIIFKPGKLTPEERKVMQTHTTVGAELLQQLARYHGFTPAFARMAIDIARHHHERYDGGGYPDGLAGEAIPLAARFVAIADMYDALRSARVYKPAYCHDDAVQEIKSCAGHFDPALLDIFERHQHDFERIFDELADDGPPTDAGCLSTWPEWCWQRWE
jgi:putative two-component system response regulator